MSDLKRNVEAKIDSIHPAERGTSGFVDVKLWLKDGREVDVLFALRLFYRRADVSIDEMRSAAIERARRVCDEISKELPKADALTDRIVWGKQPLIVHPDAAIE